MRLRFETATCFYVAWLAQDLFGKWQVIRTWGSKTSRLGGMDTVYCADQAECLEVLEQVRKRRAQRGYREVLDQIT